MSTNMQIVHWNTCRGNAWANLFGVDLNHAHFNNLRGIYIIWHGGKDQRTLKVGQGPLRARLEAERRDPTVLSCKDLGVFVSWIVVPVALADGIERFLIETLRPRVMPALPTAPAMAVNLPGIPLSPGQVPAPVPPDSTLPTQSEEAAKAGGVLPVLSAPAASQASSLPGVSGAAPRAARIGAILQAAFDEKVGKLGAGTSAVGAAKQSLEDSKSGRAVQFLMEEAIHARASDIHIEPMAGHTRVRIRIDGLLEEGLIIPDSMNLRVVPRIRVMAGLDPEQGRENAKPQDGRIAVTVDNEPVDVRLSTIPTNFGEKAVLRLIRRSTKVRQLAELGMGKKMIDAVSQLVRRPQGMLIVTGPAGNGKSTTIYSILQSLNTPERNIVTLEDPVELVIPGINQSAVKSSLGFTFASGLKSILRQDPNVIMVGEIRDSETADMSMSAALTGHVLFSTMHTNSAIGAVTRFLDMGLEPYVIASALTGVVAQRLVRRICDNCKESYEMSEQVRAEIAGAVERAGIGYSMDDKPPLYRGRGCLACRDTGYVGRMLLFELVQITQGIRHMILQKAPLSDLQAAALAEGAQTLFADGLRRVREGVTTLDEVLRMVAVET